MRPRIQFVSFFLLLLSALLPFAQAQTDCADGNGILDKTPPKDLSPQEVIQKFLQGENKVKEARSHYSFTQDVLVQTLNDKTPDGQFHEVTSVSYDDKGRRLENVTFSEQSTLRGIQMSAEDMDDIRVFMQWILTSDEAEQYNITYAGQQHVDDLDTYVFHIVAKKKKKIDATLKAGRGSIAAICRWSNCAAKAFPTPSTARKINPWMSGPCS